MKDFIDKQAMWEKAAKREEEAFQQVKKYHHCSDPLSLEQWKHWSAILAERTAFKHDLMDAPTVSIGEAIHAQTHEWTAFDKDSMPEKFGGYLVTVLYPDNSLDVEIWDWNPNDKEWNDGDTCGCSALAWMPVPKPF